MQTCVWFCFKVLCVNLHCVAATEGRPLRFFCTPAALRAFVMTCCTFAKARIKWQINSSSSWSQFEHGNFIINCKIISLDIKECRWVPKVFISVFFRWRGRHWSHSERLLPEVNGSASGLFHPNVIFMANFWQRAFCFIMQRLYHLCIDGNTRFWG